MEPREALIQEARAFAYASTQTRPRGPLPDEIRFRLDTYNPQVVDRRTGRLTYVCPQCAIREGRKDAPLRATPGTAEYDVLVCGDSYCGASYIIPFDS